MRARGFNSGSASWGFTDWNDDGTGVYFKGIFGEAPGDLFISDLDGNVRRLLRFNDPAIQASRTEFAVNEGVFYFTIPDHQAGVWVADLATGR